MKRNLWFMILMILKLENTTLVSKEKLCCTWGSCKTATKCCSKFIWPTERHRVCISWDAKFLCKFCKICKDVPHTIMRKKEITSSNKKNDEKSSLFFVAIIEYSDKYNTRSKRLHSSSHFQVTTHHDIEVPEGSSWSYHIHNQEAESGKAYAKLIE